jgi:glyoxylase-like metal-dependent hydrolase (beta-lactamase superfamily II)
MADSITIDTNHLGRAGVIACYLITGSVPILIDPGPAVVLPTIESALIDHNLRLADIGAILLTHIHLDHAGAVGSIVAAHPHIKVYVHHRGAPHLIDPSRLLNSATRIYGDMMGTLWGDFLAIPESNLHILHGGESLTIGDQRFNVYDAPGHAVHHVMYHWNDAVFVGDNAGIRMQGFTYVRPATPPPDIDLEALDRSIALMRTLAPQRLYLTHFGPVSDVEAHLTRVQQVNWRWANLVKAWIDAGMPPDEQVTLLRQHATAEMGADATEAGIQAYQKGASIEMSWQGLHRYWLKRQTS